MPTPMSDVERIELAPGYSISRILNGCWQLTPDHGGGPSSETETHRIFAELVDAGFTTFDCADIYIGVEESIGRFRKTLSDPDSIQIHTKYAPDKDTLHELTRQKTRDAIDRSLRRLGVERLDMVQFHWWRYELPGCTEMLETLLELQRSGKIRLLGVTNFDTPHLERLLKPGVELVAIQCQYSLLDRRPEKHMIDMCDRNGIRLIPYGVLAGGFLTDRYIDASEPESMNRSLVKYRLIIEEVGGWQALQRLLAALQDVASRHSVPVSTVAARWALDQPSVAAISLGVGSKSRAAENRALSHLKLTDGDREQITAVVESLGIPPGDVYELERDSEGPHSKIIKMNLHDSQ